jgi:Fe2+ transport system protein FeoA
MNEDFEVNPELELLRAPAALSPLPRVKAGRTVRIRELCASPEVSCRLREIGLGEGQIIKLVACSANIICQVCNARLALNTKLAQLIMVEACAE